jgi:hypothetical protein
MKALFLAVVGLASMASGALATPWFYMSSTTDYEHPVCSAEAALYATVTVHIFADVETGAGIDAITAAEFRVADLPGEGDGVLVTPQWATPLVIGSLDQGIALAFSPPVAGPLCDLGLVEFFVTDGTLLGVDRCMAIAQTLDSAKLVVVDQDYNEIPAEGGVFVFNPSATASCTLCPDLSATGSSSWGSVKDLY